MTIQIVLGEHNLSKLDSTELLVGVSKWISHPNYDPNIMRNDIALIKLDKKIEFSDTILPVCFPSGVNSDAGSNGVVTGWVRFLYY